MSQLTGAENVIWDLSIFYKSIDDPAIATDLEAVRLRAEKFAETYRGKVATLSATELAAALAELEQIYEQSGKISSFASLNWQTDTINPQFGAMLQKVREAGAQLEQILLFFTLEWTMVSDEHARIADDPALAKYAHYLKSQLRYRPHLLSEPEEKILSEKEVTGKDAGVASLAKWSTQLSSSGKAKKYRSQLCCADCTCQNAKSARLPPIQSPPGCVLICGF